MQKQLGSIGGASTNADICNCITLLKSWERIYLQEGDAGFYVKRRGRTTKMETIRVGQMARRHTS